MKKGVLHQEPNVQNHALQSLDVGAQAGATLTKINPSGEQSAFHAQVRILFTN